MAIDERPGQGDAQVTSITTGALNSRIKVILIVLGVLMVAEIYSLNRMAAMGKALKAQDAKTRQELVAQFDSRLSSSLSSFAQTNQEQLEALKTELDQDSRHLGAQRGELRRARNMVAQLQNEHARQMSDLKQEIALKADQQQLGALTADVSDTKTDLSKTKKNVDDLASSFGMTRTQFGTLIARNHGEIEALRKLGERNYYEFTLYHGRPIRLANIGLDLKKTNKKHHRFRLDMLVDDVWVEKKDRTVNEPIFFTSRGSRTFCELVVNKVDKGVISGYISTPKSNPQMASRSEGTQ